MDPDSVLVLFNQVYLEHHSLEICIAELKRKGFTQMATIRVLMEALAISAVEADELVLNSVVWAF